MTILGIIIGLLVIGMVLLATQKHRPVEHQLDALWPADHQCVRCGKPTNYEAPMCPHCKGHIEHERERS
jgi:predicted amidophosphoribosyltransferase